DLDHRIASTNNGPLLGREETHWIGVSVRDLYVQTDIVPLPAMTELDPALVIMWTSPNHDPSRSVLRPDASFKPIDPGRDVHDFVPYALVPRFPFPQGTVHGSPRPNLSATHRHTG